VYLAVQNLQKLGYRRIGLALPGFFVAGRGTRWLDGFLLCQHRMTPSEQIPVFVGSPKENSFKAFQRWHRTWRPDVLLTLYGHEREWLEKIGLAVPKNIGLACLIRPPGSSFAGIDDRYGEIGAVTVELTASKIGFNHYGIPPISRLILIEGRWLSGRSIRRQVN
jgi:hypothetical protein